MSLIYLSLGSNLGDRGAYLSKAIGFIEQEIGPVTARSLFYETDPWGFHSTNKFLNACIAAETTLSPSDCLGHLKGIETRLGRLKSAKNSYSDRVIDIDMLFFDNIIQDADDLILPHPHLHTRDFVLRPLLDIAPDLVHPVLKKTIRELFTRLSSQS